MRNNGAKHLPASAQRTERAFFRHTLVVISLVLLALGLSSILWFALTALLLAFAGLLLAIFLHMLSDPLSRYTGMGSRVSLAIFGSALVGLGGAAAWWVGPSVAKQVDELREILPQSFSGAGSGTKLYHYPGAVRRACRRARRYAGGSAHCQFARGRSNGLLAGHARRLVGRGSRAQ